MNRSTRRRALLGSGATFALVIGGVGAAPAHAEATELIQNGTFDSGTAPWWSTANAPLRADAGRLCTDVPAGAANPWDVSLGHNDVPLVDGAAYHLTFAASASAAVSVKANVQLNEDPFTAVLSRDVALAPEAQAFTYDFTGSLDSTNGTLTFQLGGAAEAWTFCLDEVSLTSDAAPPAEGAEQLQNGDFSNGDGGWFNYGTTATAVADGQLCSDVPGGLVNPWDAGVGQNGVTLKAGSEYKLSFDAAATPGATVRVAVQLGAEPFTGYFSRDIPMTSATAHQEFTFTATEDTTAAQVAFQVGANADAYRLCLDNVSLIGGDPKPPYVPDTGPRVRVNQVGYLPGGPKGATVVTEATDALSWQLKDATGTVVASGDATPRGVDSASGQNVQSIDFSSFTTAGTGYTLVADGQTSYPFDISADVYKQLRSDALQFFYIQRSGIAIDGSLVGAQYARPAGHVNVAPNQGDKNVPCQAGVCNYRLDAQGGWYDAGDHGKYVVNGGIATYQLLSTFERTKNASAVAPGALADSTLRVPERGNGTPDVLDEARWELEFLLRMQVPAGQPFAGMAHHKLHDQQWTGLPLQPQDDPQPRELHPVSTAATLNLAATAAQAARLFAPYDAAFASKALTAAKTAYAAAKANPGKIASDADGTGGGAYGDRDVSDEFYWAAAELYLTTGEQPYLTDVQASPHNTGDVFDSAGFSWGSTAALGRLDLATVPSLLPAAEKQRIRDSVVAAADAYVATANGQAYGLPMAGDAGHYFWGANSNIINNGVVLATAFDLTGTARYRDAALQGMDYIFGRNALNNSYVTGWGEKFSQNQHTRIYSHQLDESLPHPPPGSIAGGANSGLDDPFAKGLLAGCKPMFCYVDDIQSYATNEVAINWNSALAWMSSFLADQGAVGAPAVQSCQVTYVTHGDWRSGFTSQVTIRNTGRSAIDGWDLRWSFLGGQKIDRYWLAQVSQSGAAVSAKNVSSNRRIQPGSTVTFGFTATSTGGPNPNPNVFTLNGSRCS